MGSIRVRVALRLKNVSDYSVSSFLGHIQSTMIDENDQLFTIYYLVIDGKPINTRTFIDPTAENVLMANFRLHGHSRSGF